MKFLQQLFHIPSPVELGKSDCNALPSKFFPNDIEDEYTWEDYDLEMSAKYPIKWFITHTIPRWWSRYVWGHLMLTPLERLIYWFDFHLLHRYHVLSLKQPGKEGYKYGWLAVDDKILYANFNILMNFYHNEFINYNTGFTAQELTEPWAQDQERFIQDIQQLVQYWTKDRQQHDDHIRALSRRAYLARRNQDEKRRLYTLVYEEEKKFSEQENEMLVKLITTLRHKV